MAATVLAFFFLLVSAFLAEFYMGWHYRSFIIVDNLMKPERHFLLKEFRPLQEVKGTIPDEYSNKCDSLSTNEISVRTDENGFIAGAPKHEKPDLRIIFIGGSTTECALVSEENRFPELTGKLLSEKLKLKINTYNGGVSGSNSLNLITNLLAKAAPLEPDIVVFMENINDLNLLLRGKNYWDDGVSIVRAESAFFLLVSSLFPNTTWAIQTLSKLIKKPRQLPVDRTKITRLFAMNVESFIAICKARNITPVLMTQSSRLKEKPDGIVKSYWAAMPKYTFGISYSEYRRIYNSFNEVIRTTAKQNNVRLIDLAKLIPQEKEYIYDLVHYNDTGSQLAARLISEKLSEEINLQENNNRR